MLKGTAQKSEMQRLVGRLEAAIQRAGQSGATVTTLAYNIKHGCGRAVRDDILFALEAVGAITREVVPAIGGGRATTIFRAAN